MPKLCRNMFQSCLWLTLWLMSWLMHDSCMTHLWLCKAVHKNHVRLCWSWEAFLGGCARLCKAVHGCAWLCMYLAEQKKVIVKIRWYHSQVTTMWLSCDHPPEKITGNQRKSCIYKYSREIKSKKNQRKFYMMQGSVPCQSHSPEHSCSSKISPPSTFPSPSS